MTGPAPVLLVRLFAAAAVLLAAAGARAQGFALDRFDPSGGGSDWFTLESLDFRGNGRPSVSLWADHAHKPLVLFDRDGEEIEAVVERQTFLHAVVGFNLLDRLRLGLALPFVVDQPGAQASVGGVEFPAPAGAAVGDLRLGADVRLLGQTGDPLVLAVGAFVYFPTGQRDSYTGDEKVRATPRLLLAGDAGPIAWAARLGVSLRPELESGAFGGDATGVGPALEGGVGLGVRATEALLLGAEFHGSSVLVDGSLGEARATPLEVLFGGHLRLGDFRVGAGVAPGLTDGVGTPAYRIVARAEYFPEVERDRDGDGVLDGEDACPDTPGRRTGDPATNGCPPRDRDRDDIIDDEDACPAEPGPRSSDPRKNGCPLPPDRDKDGVLDQEDACPDEPGVHTRDPKTNGCPEIPDRDQDGIPDEEDACPDQAGPKTDDPTTTGCPDRDKDGVLDKDDACPDMPGPRDPDPKKNGCPVARIERGQIRILEQVKFRLNSAEILPESERVLSAVQDILEDHPEIKKVRVEGHTDNIGSAPYNKKLSDRRAASVVKWLVDHGIDAGRLESRGFGKERPIATNKTEEGRRENRRVEFHIVDPPQTEEAP